MPLASFQGGTIGHVTNAVLISMLLASDMSKRVLQQKDIMLVAADMLSVTSGHGFGTNLCIS